jgi:hypothetical protein
MSHIIDLDNAKGYASEANLRKALVRNGLADWELAQTIIIARKANGQFTAIFVLDRSKGGYIAAASELGFYTV